MYFYLKQTLMTIISVLLVQLCLTVSLEIHKTACLINLFSGHSYHVETCHLICSTYFLTGFFAVVMSTDGVFRTDYTSGVHIFLEITTAMKITIRLYTFCQFGTFLIRFFTSSIDNF